MRLQGGLLLGVMKPLSCVSTLLDTFHHVILLKVNAKEDWRGSLLCLWEGNKTGWVNIGHMSLPFPLPHPTQNWLFIFSDREWHLHTLCLTLASKWNIAFKFSSKKLPHYFPFRAHGCKTWENPIVFIRE